MEQVLSLFDKLAERTSLFLASLGFVLFLAWALNGSTIGSFVLTLKSTEKWSSLTLSIFLLGIGIWKILSEQHDPSKESSKKDAQELEENQSRLHKRVIAQQSKIQTLEDKIENVRLLVANRDDELSFEIARIFYGIDNAILNFAQAAQNAPLIAKWLEYKIEELVSSLTISDYPELQKTKNGSFKKFKQEILVLLQLLIESIREGIDKDPKKAGIKLHIDRPFLYRRALRSIRGLIYKELEESGELNDTQQDELMDCLNQLIEDIN